MKCSQVIIIQRVLRWTYVTKIIAQSNFADVYIASGFRKWTSTGFHPSNSVLIFVSTAKGFTNSLWIPELTVMFSLSEANCFYFVETEPCRLNLLNVLFIFSFWLMFAYLLLQNFKWFLIKIIFVLDYFVNYDEIEIWIQIKIMVFIIFMELKYFFLNLDPSFKSKIF